MSAARLARPEILGLRPYRTARQERDTLRLNANEAPWALSATGNASSLNRYPPIRPRSLEKRLAGHYGVAPADLLATRGASEAIDLLIRVFCRPGLDNIVITSPTFSMYRVYADIQGAGVISAPLRPERGFAFDVRGVLDACTPNSKLIFICSPNNPTGGLASASEIAELAGARQGRSLIVVDEAYVEFSGAASLTSLCGKFDNLVVLRTLSKALALAGARCGAVIGAAELIGLLRAVLAPYAFATPVIDCVQAALAPANVRAARASVERIVRERERLSMELGRQPLVRKVWPSRANFLLAQFGRPASVREALRDKRILIRDLHGDAGLPDCFRITVGSREENDRLLRALAAIRESVDREPA